MKKLFFSSINTCIEINGMIENLNDLDFSISDLSDSDIILLRENCVSRAEVEVEFEMELRGI